MKRTPLKRRTPLKARQPWRPRRRPKPAGVIVADIWREGLGPCAVCGRSSRKWRIDAHHIIPKRVLIRLGFSEYVMDKRNRLPVCRDHHESHHNRSHPLPRRLLPEAAFAFADELGISWYLDRHYPKEAA